MFRIHEFGKRWQFVIPTLCFIVLVVLILAFGATSLIAKTSRPVQAAMLDKAGLDRNRETCRTLDSLKADDSFKVLKCEEILENT